MPMQSSDFIGASQHKMAMINAIRDITDPRLKSRPKLLLIMLLTRSEPFDLTCTPSYEELAADIGASTVKCHDAARTLEKLGFIKREARRGRSNVFHVHGSYILSKGAMSRLNPTYQRDVPPDPRVAQSDNLGEDLVQRLAVRDKRVPLDGAEFFKYLDSAPKQDVP